MPDIFPRRTLRRIEVGVVRPPARLETPEQPRMHRFPVRHVLRLPQRLGHLDQVAQCVQLDPHAVLRPGAVPIQRPPELVVDLGQERAVARLQVHVPRQFHAADQVHPDSRRIPGRPEIVRQPVVLPLERDHGFPGQDIAVAPGLPVRDPGAHGGIDPGVPEMQPHEVVDGGLRVRVRLEPFTGIGEVHEVERPQIVIGPDRCLV